MPKKTGPQKFVKLTEEFTRAVTDYLLVETELAPADIAIVFGSNGRDVLSSRAADLYKRGLVKKIIVSGGVYNHFKQTEAHDIAGRLIKRGVPEKDIFIENRARNSGENVVYSKKLAARAFGLDKIDSIIAVGSIQASRRFLMTLKRHWPEPLVMIAPANPFHVDKEKWYTAPAFKESVLTEYNKIAPYLKRGYLKEVDINDINRRARLRKNSR